MEMILNLFNEDAATPGRDAPGPQDQGRLPCMSTIDYLSKQVITNSYNILILASQQRETASSQFVSIKGKYCRYRIHICM